MEFWVQLCMNDVVREYLRTGDIFFFCSNVTIAQIILLKHLLFEYEYALTPRMKQQMMREGTVDVHGKQGRKVSIDLHMEHINKECKQVMGSLGSNIGDKAVCRMKSDYHSLLYNIIIIMHTYCLPFCVEFKYVWFCWETLRRVKLSSRRLTDR